MVSYTDFPQNATITDAISWITSNVPIFVPMMQLAIFIFIFSLGYNIQLLKRGKASIQAWATVAQFVNFVSSLMLTMINNIVGGFNILINATILLLFAMWLLFSQSEE